MRAEAFYTGGGIWLSAVDMGDGLYGVVDSDFVDCLTVYDHEDEDQDIDFPCQNMVASHEVKELTEDELHAWAIAYQALQRSM